MKRRLSLPLLLLLLALTFAACAQKSHDTPSTDSGDDGGVEISITDAPFPFDAVKRAVVAIQRIELRGADGRYHSLIDFGDDGHDVDLVPLRNGIAERLGRANPPAGLYDAIRVILRAREIVIDDEGHLRRFTDFVGDAIENGIEAKLEEPIRVDRETLKGLLLDLDLARSFILQGRDKIDGFRFAPVLRVVNEHRAGKLVFRVKSDVGTPDDTADDRWLLGAEFTLTARDDEVAGGGASGTDPEDARRAGFVGHRALPAGTYLLEIAARSHEPYEMRIQIIENERTDLGVITLVRRGTAIRGTVTTEIATLDDETVTVAIPFARVEASFPEDDAALAKDRTNAHGKFELTGLEAGDFVVRASQLGFETAEANVTVDDDGTREIDVVLTAKTGELSGTVRNAAGNVQAGATVRVETPLRGAWHGVAETTADLEGAYAFPELPTGVYAVVAMTADGGARRWLVFVGGKDPRTLDLKLR